MNKKNSDFVFLGGSVSSRSVEDAEQISSNVDRLLKVLDSLNYTYEANILKNKSITKEAYKSAMPYNIPKKHLDRVTPETCERVSGLRAANMPYQLKDEIAVHFWTMDMLEKAVACIFDMSTPGSGLGFVIGVALQKDKPCLLIFPENMRITTHFNGSLNRLLVTKRWNDDIELIVKDFLKKVEGGFDKVMQFRSTIRMTNLIESGKKKYNFSNRSEYIRYLIEKDHED